MYLIIDVGNTRVKTAVFDNETLIEKRITTKKDIEACVVGLTKDYKLIKGIISSVGGLSKDKVAVLQKMIPFLLLDATVKLPFKNLYATPKTLGVDRIAHAAAAVVQFESKNVLIIDSGTCLTYDFINSKGEYLGGAISLGVQLRFNALHHFTAKLPLLNSVEDFPLIGDSTLGSIHSGVLNGICNEIKGVIYDYERRYENLTVVLTGGDAEFLAKQLKNGIFAIPNFVLDGLFSILKYNS